ncbi:pilin [Pseudomonas viridiflava]|uniref:pilin n=1 Tax=Pseudomonas viridiflava TaxID=33069 RepID=UPI003BF7F66C
MGANGVITSVADAVNSNAAIRGQTITLTPTVVAGGNNVLTWSCGGTIDVRFRPSSCRN